MRSRSWRFEGLPLSQSRLGGASRRRWLVMPKEHGAWALLLVPLATGMAVGNGLGLRGIFLVAGILALFLSRYPILLYLRTRQEKGTSVLPSMGLFLSLGVASFLPLVLYYRLWLLLPFGALALSLFLLDLRRNLARTDRSLSGQMLGLVSLSLSGPVGYYVSEQALDGLAVKVWAMNLLFFIPGIIYVRARLAALVKPAHPRLIGTSRIVFGSSTLASHGVILLVSILAGWAGWLPPLAFISLLPASVHRTVGVLKLNREVKVKHLGRVELIYSLVFVLMVIGIFRLTSF